LAANPKDKELRNLIKKDVDRTLQETPFFREEAVKEKMNELLYLWAQYYPAFGYQQGMNETLAIILVALFSEIE